MSFGELKSIGLIFAISSAGERFAAYCRVRNSDGVIPVAERKARVKALWS